MRYRQIGLVAIGLSAIMAAVTVQHDAGQTGTTTTAAIEVPMATADQLIAASRVQVAPSQTAVDPALLEVCRSRRDTVMLWEQIIPHMPRLQLLAHFQEIENARVALARCKEAM